MRLARFERDNMSQLELANICGCARGTIVAIENGYDNPSFKLARRIAKALGFRLDTVIPNDPDPEDKIEVDPDLSCICHLFGPNACARCYPSGYRY